ncbi:NADH-quinone oxidoreductase subunit N [Actinopolyspora halophila]|uniref:NADH-quinone oxidoreductase subunit N n=1 Tax=Actinopolyspora halophila TaxID=1850 RepID=UPI000377E3D5|nr:NADH-quinone oxidoreductase subunit N [Actinopolyspora halophila]
MGAGPLVLLPELAPAAGAVLGLLLGSWLPRGRQWVVRLVGVAACLAGVGATLASLDGVAHRAFEGSYAVDTATQAGRLIVLGGTLLVLLLSGDTVRSHPRETEFYALVLLGGAGTVVLAGTTDLLLLVAGYLLASVPLYALAGFSADAPGTEASLKYYLLGALLGITMIAGVTMLYGAGRSTEYAALARSLPAAPSALVAVGGVTVLAGLLFKIGAVPAHFWVPDVAEGASAPVAAFVTTVPKIGGLIATFRLAEGVLPAETASWPLLFAVLATASMTLGNLAALFQDEVRRLLAYSTISQVGYLLLAVVVAASSELAEPALLFYLLAYAVTNLGAFAVVAGFPHARRLAEYRGLARRRPTAAAVLVVCLLGLVGTPPTAVFLGKLEVFSAAVDGGYAWLAVVAVVNTVISLFYYLRWLVPVLAPAAAEDEPCPAGRWAAFVAVFAALLSLLVGGGGGVLLPLLDGPLLP